MVSIVERSKSKLPNAIFQWIKFYELAQFSLFRVVLR